jgi:hypothetical protein
LSWFASCRRLLACLPFGLGLGWASPGASQLLQDAPTVALPAEPPLTDARSAFERQRMIGVAERMLPAFSAQGATVGAFDLFPGLAVGPLFTSNIFANNDNRRSDVAVVVRPELTVRTSGGPYQLEAFGRGDFRRYAHYRSENSQEGLGGVRGSVAVGPLSSLSAGASYATLIEPRFAADSPADAAEPLRYTSLDAFADGTIEGAATRVIFRIDASDLRFSDVSRVGGGTLFTRDRDRARYQGLVRVERAISPAVSLYAAASGNVIDYRFATVGVGTRDSRGYGFYLGSSFEVTALLRGDVRIGYIRQDFDLAGIRALSGLGALGTLVFSPNRLWTITAKGESSIEDSGVPGSGGFLHRGGSLRADNELRRYLILSIEGGYYQDSYRGLQRRDKLPYVDTGLTYLSRNHWNARLGYRYLSRSCSCSAGVADFDDHRVSATLTFQI